ncbi:hypothetical protein [Rhodobacter sp. NSM]|uniref:hypothetical protein n=1 Tax=Rhodobacter sp. NSM TaxID=3457501 RepID=UPI003FD5BFDC
MTEARSNRSSRTRPARLWRLLTQPARSLRYKALFALKSGRYQLDPAEFTGKRVLIIGAASCVTEELERFDPADWDVIVRMNKAIDVPVVWRGQTFRRCDVLLHNLTSDGIRDAGEVTAEKLQATSTDLLVHRLMAMSRFPNTLRMDGLLRAQGSRARLRMIGPVFHRALSADLGGSSPTAGAVAICWFLGCDTHRLGVVGFTFYTTRYLAGYQDHVASDADALTYGQYKGIHDPAAERKLVSRRVAEARGSGRDVVLGHEVERVLSMP